MKHHKVTTVRNDKTRIHQVTCTCGWKRANTVWKNIEAIAAAHQRLHDEESE